MPDNILFMTSLISSRDKNSVCVCLYKEPVQSNGISDKHAGRTEKNRVIKCDIFVYERKNFM